MNRRGGKRRILAVLAGLAGLALLVLAVMTGPQLYRILHGVEVYETTPPPVPRSLRHPAILVFSKTNGFRHDEAIAAANALFRELARENGWSLFLTENAAVHDASLLGRFDAVVWNNVSGDVLTPAQRAAFKAYLINGGGFVGVHAAGGDPSYKWRWYVEELIGAQFESHTMWPQIQSGSITVEDADHPAMRGLPPRWEYADEWYSFDRSVRDHGYRVLASLDEGSYSPKGLFGEDLRMGDHPIIWSRCLGEGRTIYSAIGHTPQSYSTRFYRDFLQNAVVWAADGAGCERER